MLSLYDKIADLCKSREKNITQMCTEAKIPRSALSDYKSGKNKTISITNIQKIAEYFDISIDELLGNEEKPSIGEDGELAEYMEALKDNPGMRVLFSKTKNATKEDIEKVIKMLDIMRGTQDE